jgi:ATP synthase protein I
MKISVDLIAGVAVGGFIGWLLDQQFPSVRPWFLVAFLFLGFAAGMLNVIRTAQRLQRQAEPMQRSAPSVADDRDET